MNAPTQAETQAVNHATQEANSDTFYKAKYEVDFCNEVIKLAAFAASMHRRLTTLNAAAEMMPKEFERINSVCADEDASEW